MDSSGHLSLTRSIFQMVQKQTQSESSLRFDNLMLKYEIEKKKYFKKINIKDKT